MSRVASVVVLLLLTTPGLSADEWPAPAIRVVPSDDGLRFVRILPGNHPIGTLQSLPGQQSARAEFYVRQADDTYRRIFVVNLQNPVSPVFARLTNDGHLVTFDNWGAIGKGSAISIYRPDGRLLRNLGLEDLYRNEEIAQLTRSTSSVQWRCEVWTWSSGGSGPFIHVHVPLGGYFSLTPESGSVKRIEGPRPSSCTAAWFQ